MFTNKFELSVISIKKIVVICIMPCFELYNIKFSKIYNIYVNKNCKQK